MQQRVKIFSGVLSQHLICCLFPHPRDILMFLRMCGPRKRNIRQGPQSSNRKIIQNCCLRWALQWYCIATPSMWAKIRWVLAMTSLSFGRIFRLVSQKIDGTYQRYNNYFRQILFIIYKCIKYSVPSTFWYSRQKIRP